MKGYFVYLGNRETVKAAGYVKEFCNVAVFGLDTLQQTGAHNLILNFTMNPPPTVQQMVEAILKVGEKRSKPRTTSQGLLLALSYPISGIGRALGIKVPINPVRVRKLVRSNNIWPDRLEALNYRYTYTLESAFQDWKQDLPEDFSK